jgi:hypothetical protein
MLNISFLSYIYYTIFGFALNIESLNIDRKIHLYPAIIVNENILTIGSFSYILRKKFDELLNENEIPKNTKNHLIKSLLVISIEQLQMLEQSISENSIDFFNLLDAYYDKIRLKKNDIYKDDILTSTTEIINRKINPKKHFSERLRSFKWLGFE